MFCIAARKCLVCLEKIDPTSLTQKYVIKSAATTCIQENYQDAFVVKELDLLFFLLFWSVCSKTGNLEVYLNDVHCGQEMCIFNVCLTMFKTLLFNWHGWTNSQVLKALEAKMNVCLRGFDPRSAYGLNVYLSIIVRVLEAIASVWVKNKCFIFTGEERVCKSCPLTFSISTVPLFRNSWSRGVSRLSALQLGNL